jgi:hypothetical protein
LEYSTFSLRVQVEELSFLEARRLVLQRPSLVAAGLAHRVPSEKLFKARKCLSAFEAPSEMPMIGTRWVSVWLGGLISTRKGFTNVRCLVQPQIPTLEHAPNQTFRLPDPQETIDAFEAGARHMTHLFNAMPPIHHREPGPIIAALANNEVTVALIPDGIHVHPAVIGLVARAIGSGRLVAITDAIAAMGMPPGEYRVGPLVAQSDGVTMRLADGTYAGSLLTMERAVQILINEVGLEPVEAIRSASETPSRLLDDRTRGAIKPGARADMAILDNDYNVRATLIAGDVVFGQLE